jgi:protein-tyrosine phosphatase
VEDALEGIGRMAAAGFRRIVTTPHLQGSLTRDPDALQEALGETDRALADVRARMAERFPGVTLDRGHEVMLDVPNPDFSDPRVRLAGGPFVLVEWPWFQIPPQTTSALQGLRAQGVTPLIAHPERYHGYDASLSHIPRWKAEGAVCQVSYGSLVGSYGPEVRARMLRILRAGWGDCLSTDFHGRPGQALYVREAEAVFREIGGEEAWTLLTSTNPGRIATGEPTLPVPGVDDRRGLLARFLARFKPASRAPISE